jgi:hypothetical protein
LAFPLPRDLLAAREFLNPLVVILVVIASLKGLSVYRLFGIITAVTVTDIATGISYCHWH